MTGYSYRVRVVKTVEEVMRVDVSTSDIETGKVEAVLAVYNQIENRPNSRDIIRLNCINREIIKVEDVGDAEVVLLESERDG